MLVAKHCVVFQWRVPNMQFTEQFELPDDQSNSEILDNKVECRGECFCFFFLIYDYGISAQKKSSISPRRNLPFAASSSNCLNKYENQSRIKGQPVPSFTP